MNKVQKTLFVGAAVFSIGGLGLTSLASAQSSTGSSLIDKLATKFNLNREEVEAVFDEEKTDRQAKHFADVSEDLQDAVDDGDLSAEQKTLIENKLKELHTAREAEHEALRTWAEENSVDMRYVMGGGRGHGIGSDRRLDDAVEDGDITETQGDLIEAKREELEAKREETREALESWAEENDINTQYLRPSGMKGGHHGGPIMR